MSMLGIVESLNVDMFETLGFIYISFLNLTLYIFSYDFGILMPFVVDYIQPTKQSVYVPISKSSVIREYILTNFF